MGARGLTTACGARVAAGPRTHTHTVPDHAAFSFVFSCADALEAPVSRCPVDALEAPAQPASSRG